MQNALRAALENAIAAMIDLLDLVDGDADFEEETDLEPSIGFGAFATPHIDVEDDSHALVPDRLPPKRLSR